MYRVSDLLYLLVVVVVVIGTCLWSHGHKNASNPAGKNQKQQQKVMMPG